MICSCLQKILKSPQNGKKKNPVYIIAKNLEQEYRIQYHVQKTIVFLYPNNDQFKSEI